MMPPGGALLHHHAAALLTGCPPSLRQVVETHRHTDVAGEADVDAEVDQPLFAWAWGNQRHHGGQKQSRLLINAYMDQRFPHSAENQIKTRLVFIGHCLKSYSRLTEIIWVNQPERRENSLSRFIFIYKYHRFKLKIQIQTRLLANKQSVNFICSIRWIWLPGDESDFYLVCKLNIYRANWLSN